MMAKKTNVVPLAGYISSSFNPSVTAEQIKQIPPYSDPGIDFKGYSKEQRGDQYVLFKQNTRFYSYANSNVASPSTITLTRSNLSTAIFYVTGILIQYKSSGSSLVKYVDLQDGSIISPRLRVFLFGDTMQNFFINLKDCPRKFDGNISILFNDGLSNLEFFHVELFGWDETR